MGRLPRQDEETDPAFAHDSGDDLPTYQSEGVWARLVAGDAFGARAKMKIHLPMFYVHWKLQAAAKAELPAEYSERAAFIATGAVEVAGQTFGAGQMLIFTPGKPVLFSAPSPVLVMLLGGESLGERYVEWNFVSSSKQRIEQAKADWRAGCMKLPDLDNSEFIPLPGDPRPPSNSMS